MYNVISEILEIPTNGANNNVTYIACVALVLLLVVVSKILCKLFDT